MTLRNYELAMTDRMNLYKPILPTSTQAPAQLKWAELVLILLYPAFARRPLGIVVKYLEMSKEDELSRRGP